MTSEELEREIKRLEEQIEDQINSLRIKFFSMMPKDFIPDKRD